MSGLIPQHFIDDLIARADIVEVVGRRVPLKKSGKEYKACCPFHNESTASFTVSPSKGFYHCFGCGAHGTALGFLMEHEHLSFVEAVESLASDMGIDVPRDETEKPARRFDELFTLMDAISNYYEGELKDSESAIAYLKRRGIDGATAKRFRIGYAPAGWDGVAKKFGTSKEANDRLLAVGQIIRRDNGTHYDRFRDRIMFPIADARGRCIGFGGRVMGDEQPKYMNTSDTVLFHKRQELYGMHEARQALRKIERLVVVEGYMDVVGLARHGIDCAVATLGTATTDEHLTRLFRLTDEVIFSFDGDRAGREAAWKALEIALPHVRDGRQIRFVFLPDGHDPDSYIQEIGAGGFEQAVASGVPLSDFLISELSSNVDMNSVDGLARFAELARPLLQKIPGGIYKELLTARLADTIGLPQNRLDAMLGAPQASTSKLSSAKRPAARKAASGRPSAIRRAITLLLHYPGAAGKLDVELLAGLSRPGSDLLRDIIEVAQAEPALSTAGLLERFRQHAEGQHLGKLAAVELPDESDFDAEAELADCLQQLAAAGARARIDYLIEKQRLKDLSGPEKDELRALSRGATADG